MDWMTNKKLDETELRINELQRQVDDIHLDPNIPSKLKKELITLKKQQIENLKT